MNKFSLGILIYCDERTSSEERECSNRRTTNHLHPVLRCFDC